MFHRKKKVRGFENKEERFNNLSCLFKFQTLYEQCNKGEGLDVSAFSKSDSRTTWKTK